MFGHIVDIIVGVLAVWLSLSLLDSLDKSADHRADMGLKQLVESAVLLLQLSRQLLRDFG